MLRDVAGQQVWVTEEGAGDPRLFIQCTLGRGRAYRPLASALPAARNIYFDLPGHGQSAPWEGADYPEDCYRIVHGLMDAPGHVVGHSYGGTLAVRLALERPDLVTRLTLIEPVMIVAAKGTAAYTAHQDILRPFVEAWRDGDLEAAAAAFVGMWGTGPDWPHLPDAVRQLIISQIHLIPASLGVVEEDRLDFMGRLGQITCPVDLIEGGKSQQVMPAILDRLQAEMPQAHRHNIADGDHMVPITHPGEVAAAILGSS